MLRSRGMRVHSGHHWVHLRLKLDTVKVQRLISLKLIFIERRNYNSIGHISINFVEPYTRATTRGLRKREQVKNGTWMVRAEMIVRSALFIVGALGLGQHRHMYLRPKVSNIDHFGPSRYTVFRVVNFVMNRRWSFSVLKEVPGGVAPRGIMSSSLHD